MEKRIYAVTDLDAASIVPFRLVRAGSQAQAVRHVATRFKAEVAGQEQLVNLLTAGVKVEETSDG